MSAPAFKHAFNASISPQTIELKYYLKVFARPTKIFLLLARTN